MAVSERRTRRTAEHVAEEVSAGAQEAAETVARQVDTATTLSRPVIDAWVRAGRQYLDYVNRMSAETVGLATQRWQHDAELAQALASDALSLHQEWAKQAASDYAERVTKMAHLAASAAFESWQPMLRAEEAARTATETRR